MNIYALFPLVATIGYISLIITTVSNRPWQRRHTLFILFLVPAMIWSLTDIFLRTNFFPQYNLLLFKIIVIVYTVMAVQFHRFLSSFYAPGQGRWLPFAYASLAVAIALVVLGYVAEGITAIGDKVYHSYSAGIIFILLFLMILATRNFPYHCLHSQLCHYQASVGGHQVNFEAGVGVAKPGGYWRW
jgi:hypothetical protein